MLTCQKCRKQSPPDAAFCGYCGARLAQPPAAAPAPGAKTVFGYNLDARSIAPPAAPEPVPAPAQPAPAPRRQAAPAGAEPTVAEPTIALTDADLHPGQDLVGSRFWQGGLIQQLPTGALYQARDVKTDIEAELLIVDAPVFPSPLDMERARRELRQLQKVECPALVKVLDHGKTEDGRLYIAMESSKGAVSLGQIVARGRLDLEQAQSVIREVGTALAEAQKMGVIHRDIAPHNVLVGSDGTVRLRGFAVAAPIRKHVFGTPEFISPEQAGGRPVDQRSNIYSLGALMYFMLCGEPPFLTSSPEEQLQKHQNEEPPSPRARCPDLSPRAEALILKAMAKSSSRRHLTLRQFLREVETLTDAAPAPAEPAAPPVSFVTPLHGVTALSGGTRPPSSELPPLGAAGPLEAVAALSQAQLGGTSPSQVERELASMETAIEAPAVPAAVEPIPPRTRQSAITGEMSSDVALRAAPQPAPAPPAPAAAAPTPAPAPAGATPGQKGAFRETMWFFKGEVESAMAETGGEAPPAAAAEATPQELTAKYADDGSLSDEEARRLSLRTGKTQMMSQVRVPAGSLPGAKMAADDFIHEMNRGRKIAIWGGVFLLLVVVISLAVWFLTR